MDQVEVELDSSSTDCEATSRPGSPARYSQADSTFPTLEARLLAESQEDLQRIMDLLPLPSKSNPSVPDKKEIKERVTSMFATIHQLYGSLVELRAAKNTTESSHCQCHQTQPRLIPSYSEIVKTNIPQSTTTKTISRSINKKIQSEGCSSSYALIVYPNEANPETSTTNMEVIKNNIIKEVKPDKLKIKVTAIRKIKGNGLCFRTSSKRDAMILEQAVQGLPEVQPQIKTRVSEGRRPRIILLNVPNSAEDDSIISTIYEQNDFLNGISKQEFEESTRISTTLTKGNTKENCRHVVLSTTPGIRNQLIKEKYISLSWANIRIDDYVHITRCFQCCGYNHLAKDCTSKQICSHCSKAHRYNECTRREQPSCCITCKLANKGLPPEKRQPTNHNAFDLKCPQTIKIREQVIKQTNYGY
ncbi:uncharacterized protein LOC111614583 [Centruroides sculpturatus]|uniref:uncharacterized protein LOC111614583 n=1 Tax=Centruroides sculpturatus TaxID=218467 RepID=UPI000C6E7D44|nr:uncharacterized protein LOC111614583 [Centruroides sculpturatus]